MSEFTQLLCAAHDLNRGGPPADGPERAIREDVLEYIDAHSVAKHPNHPTTAIAWDLQRSFGDSDGRRLLLYASRRWDAKPLRARDVVHMWWEDDYEPQAWVDEYLIDVIRDWRSERDRLQLCADAEKEWLAFNGAATLKQLSAWRGKFGAWYLDPTGRLGKVKIIKPDSNVVQFPAPTPQTTAEPLPIPPVTLMAPGGEILPSDAEDSLALDFAGQNADRLRYVEEWGRWMVWDGQTWAPDKTSAVYDRTRKHLRNTAMQLHFQEGKKVASAKTVAAVERMARTDRQIAATADCWDADPFLLNTPDGVVDLRTGEMQPSSPEHHMTKVTAVGPGGDCPTWLAFLDKSLAGDAELISFIQRVLGYALTGDTREHALFFLYGPGGNGKGVLLNTVAGILNDYNKTAPIDTFIDSANERHPTDLAGLRGARLVTASETEKGRRWAEAKIKMLTGGDRISARFMRQDFFEFVPQFKLVIAGNHKPGLRSVDEAIRRRLHLIPFTVKIPPQERDTALPERLKAEWGGILAWLIEGCLAWQRNGLQPPAAVRAATEDYLSGEDALSTWLDERCERAADAWASRQDLFGSWQRWAEAAREPVGSLKQFIAAMRQQDNVEEVKRVGNWGFRGLRIRQQHVNQMPPLPPTNLPPLPPIPGA